MARPSFKPEDLQPFIDEALAKQRAQFEASMADLMAQQAAAQAAKEPAKGKADTTAINKKIIAAFRKKGYENIVLFDRTKLLSQQPECTVLTYRKWMELGRKVIDGEHSLKVPGYPLRLFHKKQTENATIEQRKAYHAKTQAAAEKREAKEQAASA